VNQQMRCALALIIVSVALIVVSVINIINAL
jgi:hypothetical protein